RQEMYAFLPDHLSLATYPHLFGARANPDDKAALIANNDPLKGYTNPAYMTDVLGNVQMHFVIVASQLALIFMGQPQTVERNYEAKERYSLQVEKLSEPFFLGLGKWFMGAYESKSLGDVWYKQNFEKQILGIQPILFFSVFFRTMLTDLSVIGALKSWAYFYVWGWKFRTPWAFVAEGNHKEDLRIEKDARVFRDNLIRMENARKFSHMQDLRFEFDEMLKLYSRDPKRIYMFFKGLSRLPSAVVLGSQFHLGLVNRKVTGEMAREKLLMVYDGLSVDGQRFMAELMIDYSRTMPPVYTHPNKFIQAQTTFWLGAILTTYLAIDLGVESFKLENLQASVVFKGALMTSSLALTIKSLMVHNNLSLRDVVELLPRYLQSRFVLGVTEGLSFVKDDLGRLTIKVKQSVREVRDIGAAACRLNY
ncbi:MAG: hypothetical protein AB8E15_01245, partial [Bdellovibrionales bacterium]